ncbi:MAG: SpoIIIAH-like family protein [Clostridia bacterium]|nr:SpoIIIAH-like family protein [Clostridia bacterium]
MQTKTKNKRFAIILAAALLLLGAAVWLNLKLNAEDVPENNASAGNTPEAGEVMAELHSDYFSSFRAQRSALRAEEIEYLRSILDSGSADSEAVADAQTRLTELVGSMEKEFTIESLIRSKGFLDAAASLGSGTASIVVNGEALTDEEVARILDVVIGETGLPASAVKISLGED